METKQVKKLIKKTRKIEGWFSLEAALLIAALNECQNNNRIEGDIFEIGVHHGKSSILFINLLKPSETFSICDVFDVQENNYSQSGHGNKREFLNNIEKYSSNSLTHIYSCLSTELSLDVIGQNYRMFHIDGGHNKTEALPDLMLASQAIHEKGIIILDDPFRPEWPGVTEALLEFLQLRKDFTAITVGFNKLIICRNEVSNIYMDFLDNVNNRSKYDLCYPISYKKLPFVDSEIRIFFTLLHLNTKSLRVQLIKKLYNTKVFKWYKSNKKQKQI